MENNNSKKTIIKFGGGMLNILTVIFVVAKIFGIGEIANWSWWVVLLPLWGPVALCLGILACIGIFAGLYVGVAWLYYKLKKY